MYYILSIRSTATDVLGIVTWDSGEILGTFFDPQRSLMFHEVGIEKARRELDDFIARIASRLGLTPVQFRERIKSACFGLAGTRTKRDEETVRQMVRLGSRSQLFVATELDGILIANSPTSNGICIDVSTGSMTLWRGKDGQRVQVGGWGPELGDSGGGFWCGRRALRLLMRAHDGLDQMPKILCKQVLLDIFGNENEELSRLLSWTDMAVRHDLRRQISRVAKSIEKAAEIGELAAQVILAAAVDHICDMFYRVLKVSRIDASIFNDLVILEGSFIESNSYISSSVQSVIKQLLPKVKVVYPNYDGVVGLHMYALAGDEQVPQSIRVRIENGISNLSDESKSWLLKRFPGKNTVEHREWSWEVMPHWIKAINCGQIPANHWDREMP